jgi:hypothetical protein
MPKIPLNSGYMIVSIRYLPTKPNGLGSEGFAT